jgi:hypothetical protein
MIEHPCLGHGSGRHTDYCLTGGCGFCDSNLREVASGECRTCLLIVCENCDAGYDPDLGPICGPCADTAAHATGHRPSVPEPADGEEQVRLCVFKLWLSCGHLVTVTLTGWYPVVVACCDRLGGTIWYGAYVAYASDVDYVKVVSERYEIWPARTPREPWRLIGRQPRTDDPRPALHAGDEGSSGRYPARVGSTWNLDHAKADKKP